jgi:hypothetical protein
LKSFLNPIKFVGRNKERRDREFVQFQGERF